MRAVRSLRRIGIFGGTFDPVHAGHLRAAIEAGETLGLDLLIWVPARLSPHKKGRSLVRNARHRLAMLRLALQPWPWMNILDYELRKKGVGYTVDTLRFIVRTFGPKREYFFLIGSDWKRTIRTWKNYSEIRKMVRIVCVNRSPEEGPVRRGKTRRTRIREDKARKFRFLDCPVLAVDSTQIRNRLRKGRDVSGLVPEAVLRYIKRNKLYV